MTIQVPVHLSWDSPENAQEFILQIEYYINGEYNNTFRSLENDVTVLLPYYGYYSVNICCVNCCGKACENFSMSISGPQEIEIINLAALSNVPIHMHGQE